MSSLFSFTAGLLFCARASRNLVCNLDASTMMAGLTIATMNTIMIKMIVTQCSLVASRFSVLQMVVVIPFLDSSIWPADRLLLASPRSMSRMAATVSLIVSLSEAIKLLMTIEITPAPRVVMKVTADLINKDFHNGKADDLLVRYAKHPLSLFHLRGLVSSSGFGGCTVEATVPTMVRIVAAAKKVTTPKVTPLWTRLCCCSSLIFLLLASDWLSSDCCFFFQVCPSPPLLLL